MLIVKKNHLRLTKGEIKYFRLLCHNSKSLYNRVMYLTKKHYENCGKFLSYVDAYHLVSKEPVYQYLPSQTAQQTMKILERDYRSFFGLLQKKKQGNFNREVKEPHYKRKDGYFICIFPVMQGRCKDALTLIIPKSLRKQFNFTKITIPKPDFTKGKWLKEVRILPKLNAKYFEIEWVYEEKEEIQKLDKGRAISIDPGVDNFATMLDSKSGRTIILDGRKLKSYNRYYNKRKAKLQGILDKQGKKVSQRIWRLGLKRKNILNNALNQYVNFIIKYCLKHKVGKVIIGEGHLAQDGCSLGNINNQNFVNIPFGKFCQKLDWKCKKYGIIFLTQEESYTSKCDHLVGESMIHHDKYLGRRDRKNSFFHSSTGILLNDDVNGALGILIKSKHKVSVKKLVSSGCLTQPRRIRLDDIQQTSSVRLLEAI